METDQNGWQRPGEESYNGCLSLDMSAEGFSFLGRAKEEAAAQLAESRAELEAVYEYSERLELVLQKVQSGEYRVTTASGNRRLQVKSLKPLSYNC